ncbi:MAG: transcriptional regulator [Actinomyces sp.]|nr:MAG: transcriptional regulator [Actinomyces sp.]
MSENVPASPATGVSAPADARTEIKDFLTTRRAKVTPQMAGLPVVGGNRRVPGLRREEVAMLAGVSVDYYTRLERGRAAGASEEVLDALASALLLDDAERQHLFDLARSVSSTGRARRRRPRAGRAALRPGVQWLLDSMTVPALVADSLSTYVASNLMARALYSPMFLDPAPQATGREVNMARFVFLDPRSRDFFPNWDSGAEDLVAMLRLAAGAGPTDPRLTALVGELSTRSREFSRLWARHDVRYVCRGEKVIRHPVVGELRLAYEPMPLTTAPGMRMTAYAVEPGSPSQDALQLLASWAATEPAPAAERGPAAPSSCPCP